MTVLSERPATSDAGSSAVDEPASAAGAEHPPTDPRRDTDVSTGAMRSPSSLVMVWCIVAFVAVLVAVLVAVVALSPGTAQRDQQVLLEVQRSEGESATNAAFGRSGQEGVPTAPSPACRSASWTGVTSVCGAWWSRAPTPSRPAEVTVT